MKYLESDMGNANSTALKVRGRVDIDVRDGTTTGLMAKLNLTGARVSNTSPIGTIHFNNNNSNQIGIFGFHSEETSSADKSYFKFNHNVDVDSNTISGIKKLECATNTFITTDGLNAIKLRRSTSGNDGQAQTEIERAHNNTRRTFAIRGREPGKNSDSDIFYVYTNLTGGDSAEYKGRISNQWDLVNKKYVDDAIKAAVDAIAYRAKRVATLPQVPVAGMLYAIGDQLQLGT